ncbi:pseudouridine synthase [Rhodoferax sp.]|uniref:pseudouridine synthase n=1 Tax=Rhodoferax sp. TaxID=50421 RepID=UPI0025E87314|nr:pseudouridine synthase [Rhodoferax sp.]
MNTPVPPPKPPSAPVPFRRAAPPAGAAGTASSSDPIRLNKRMADLNMCSRREADEWIAKGWVKVNGAIAEMGVKVTPSDRIQIDKAASGHQANQVTILINKPMGYVSAQAEDGHEPAVTLFTAQNRWAEDNARFFFHPNQLRGLAPAGRLDIDSIGLLVMTQDGRVARQLIGEDSVMEKEYLVRVAYHGLGQPAPTGQLIRMDDDDPITTNVQAVFPPAMLAKLRHGLSLDGQQLKPAKVTWQNPEQLRIVLTEGKKRQIRRMCELVGLKVVGLKRVRIGNVMLGNLPVGQWRYLAPHEGF